jgi:putative oxidoreductase
MSSRLSGFTYALMRAVTGFLFSCHGAQKLFGWFGGIGPVPGDASPVMSLLGLAAILEFVGGIAIILGLWTRPVAFVLAGEMAVAYFMVHQPQGALPIQNHGESAVLFCFTWLFFSTHGAGAFSLDAWRRSRALARYREQYMAPSSKPQRPHRAA